MPADSQAASPHTSSTPQPSSKYDWELLRRKYVMGDMSYRDLASQPGTPHVQTIKKRAVAEAWPEQRAQYRASVITTARERVMDDQTVDATMTIERHIRIARSMQSKALKRLQELKPENLSARDVLDYLRVSTEIERQALGLDTIGQGEDGELDAIAAALQHPIRPVN